MYKDKKLLSDNELDEVSGGMIKKPGESSFPPKHNVKPPPVSVIYGIQPLSGIKPSERPVSVMYGIKPFPPEQGCPGRARSQRRSLLRRRYR